jgi:hypothetical protein
MMIDTFPGSVPNSSEQAPGCQVGAPTVWEPEYGSVMWTAMGEEVKVVSPGKGESEDIAPVLLEGSLI